MLHRLRPAAAFISLALVACGSDQTISHQRTPTPGAPTPTPAAPTPAPKPLIRVEPPSIDFGAQGVGCELERDVTVYNDGGATLTVYSITLSVASSPDYAVGDTVLEIAPGASQTVGVQYTVAGEGDDEGTLLIQSNDQDAGTLTVALTGAASANVPFEQTFTQASGGKADILFALDVTSYATEYIGAFAVNVPPLFPALDAAGVSWQAAWMSLDPVDQAKFHGTYGEGDRSYLKQGDGVDQITAFQQSLAQRLTAVSSAQTPGLQLINAGLLPENQVDLKAGFLREDALLIVLVGSVYDDDSVNAQRLPVPVDELKDALVAVKGDSDLVRFDAVVAEQGGGCAREEGARYMQMSAALDGFVENICFQSWTNTLLTLADQVQRLEDTFVLDETPQNASSISVSVNDAAVPMDTTNGWSWDEGANAVQFHGTAVPPAGASITVRFERGGACVEE